MYSGIEKLKKKKVLSPVNNSYLNIFQQQENSQNSVKEDGIMIARINNYNELLTDSNDKLPQLLCAQKNNTTISSNQNKNNVQIQI